MGRSRYCMRCVQPKQIVGVGLNWIGGFFPSRFVSLRVSVDHFSHCKVAVSVVGVPFFLLFFYVYLDVP